MEHDSPSLPDLGLPFITNFSAKQYHAHPNNFDVVQDKNGILYFGNLWGILQFDGTHWRNIYLPHGASCTSLAMDQDGTIYAAGRNSIGYLATDSIGRKFYVSLLGTLPAEERTFNEVWKTIATTDGVFFASYEKLMFKKRGEEKVSIIRKNSWYVFKAREQAFITGKTGLYTYRNDRVEKVPGTERLDGLFINGITSMGDSLLISTSEEGLFLFYGNHVVPWNTDLNRVITQYNPTKILNADNRYLVVSTELNGIIITDLHGTIIYNLNQSTGLAGNTVSGFFIDKDKLLWLTLYNGIAFIPLFNHVSYINDYSGVSGVPYSSAYHDGRLYLATSEGLFYKAMAASSPTEKFKRVPGIGLAWNLSIIDNKLFCGQAITALMIASDHTGTLYNEGSWMFLQLKEKDRIMMGTYSGLHYLKKENGKWQYEKKIKGFKGACRNFVEDRFGDIWVSHGNKGVYRLRIHHDADSVSQLKLYRSDDIHPFRRGTTVNQINNTLIITSDSGLFRYDYEKEKIVSFDKLNKLLFDKGYVSIKKIIPESPRKLWFIEKNGGIAKIEWLPGDNFQWIAGTEQFRGTLITDFEHFNPVTPDKIIIGTLDGFALYKPGPKQDTTGSFNTFISNVETPASLIADGDYTKIESTIPFKENSLKLTFAVNAYQNLASTQYQYYLQGFRGNEQWSRPAFSTYKEYTNLPAGHYVFHVRAVNFEGKLSEEATMDFVILPPWYRSWWAYLFYTLVVALFILLSVFLIRKRIENVKARTAREEQHYLWLKQKEWEEIDLANKKTLMTLQQDKLQIEKSALEQKTLMMEQEKEKERKIMEMQKEKLEADLRHKNNELSSLTLHITQKNEILTRITNQLSKAIQSAADEPTIKNLKDIKTQIQKGLQSANEWEKFTEHFDSVHEGFLKRLKQTYPDLSASTLKLCAFIKMRLTSKEIATLMNTAPDSVLKARYRLRTKFKLEKETGLEEFLNNF